MMDSIWQPLSSRYQAFNAAAQRDSKVELQMGEEAKREASAMKGIGVVTMTFLPATFVSVSCPVPCTDYHTFVRLNVVNTTHWTDDLWNQLLLV
jgi:hypothetical protein